MKYYSRNPTCLFKILDVSSHWAYGMRFRHMDRIQGIRHKTYTGMGDTERKYYAVKCAPIHKGWSSQRMAWLLCHSNLWELEAYLTLHHISPMKLLYWSSSLDTHSLGCPWQAFCFQHHCAFDLSSIMDKKDHARISKQGQWFLFEPFMCIHCLSPPAV